MIDFEKAAINALEQWRGGGGGHSAIYYVEFLQGRLSFYFSRAFIDTSNAINMEFIIVSHTL